MGLELLLLGTPSREGKSYFQQESGNMDRSEERGASMSNQATKTTLRNADFVANLATLRQISEEEK